jgi:hypothetical protein
MVRSVFGRPIVVVLASVILASCLIVALSGTALAASIQRVSVSSSGAQGNSGSDQASMSADARYVAFDSQATNLVPGRTAGGIYFRDLVSGTTQLIAAAAGPSVSATGRYVAFWSDSPSLLPDDTNGYANAFLWDRDTGAIERVSVSSMAVTSSSGLAQPIWSPVTPTTSQMCSYTTGSRGRRRVSA